MDTRNLRNLTEFQLKLLAKQELGRDVHVWKKSKLITIIEEHRAKNGQTGQTSEPPRSPSLQGKRSVNSGRGMSTNNAKRNVAQTSSQASTTPSRRAPPVRTGPPARKVSAPPANRKDLTIVDGQRDLNKYTPMQLRDLAKTMGLSVNTFNKRKLITMIEESRGESSSAKPPTTTTKPPRQTQAPAKMKEFTPPNRTEIKRSDIHFNDAKETSEQSPPRIPPPMPAEIVKRNSLRDSQLQKIDVDNTRQTGAGMVEFTGNKVVANDSQSKEEIVSLQREKAGLERELETAKTEIARLQRNQAAQELSSAQNELRHLNQLVESQRREIEQLRREKEEALNSSVSEGQESFALKEELSRLRDRITDLESQRESEKELLQKLQDERSADKQELIAAQTSIRSLNSEKEKLSETNEELKRDISFIEQELESSQQDFETHTSDLRRQITEQDIQIKQLSEKSFSTSSRGSENENQSGGAGKKVAGNAMRAQRQKERLKSSELPDLPARKASPRLPERPSKQSQANEVEEIKTDLVAPQTMSQQAKERGHFGSQGKDINSPLYEEVALYGADSPNRASTVSDSVMDGDSKVRSFSTATDSTDLTEFAPPSHQIEIDNEITEYEVLRNIFNEFEMHYPAEYWWYQDKNLETQGPVTFNQLQMVSDITLETYVWNGGNVPDWGRIQDLEGIAHLLPN